MYIEPFLLFSLLVLSVMMGGALVVLLLLYDRVSHELRRHERKGEVEAKRLKEHARTIVERARSQSIALLDGANRKAQTVLEQAQVLSKDAKDALRGELEEVAKREKEAIHRTSDALIREYQGVMEKVEEDIAEEARTEVVSIHKELDKRMEEQYAKLEQEIAAYKAQSLAKIDASIYRVLGEVAKRVIGKTLSFDDHQELVMKALEEAKKDELF